MVTGVHELAEHLCAVSVDLGDDLTKPLRRTVGPHLPEHRVLRGWMNDRAALDNQTHAAAGALYVVVDRGARRPGESRSLGVCFLQRRPRTVRSPIEPIAHLDRAHAERTQRLGEI